MHNLNSLEISNDAMILFEKVGITTEVIDEMKKAVLFDCSNKFHNQIVERKIMSSWDNYEQWFKDGFPAQVITPGENWKKGKFRLRIVAEFISDEEVENEPEQPIEPSLDTFR